MRHFSQDSALEQVAYANDCRGRGSFRKSADVDESPVPARRVN